jgi:hypothetical protein
LLAINQASGFLFDQIIPLIITITIITINIININIIKGCFLFSGPGWSPVLHRGAHELALQWLCPRSLPRRYFLLLLAPHSHLERERFFLFFSDRERLHP